MKTMRPLPVNPYEKKCIIMMRAFQDIYPNQRIGIMMNGGGDSDWSIYFEINRSSITIPRTVGTNWVDLKRIVKVQLETSGASQAPICGICSFNVLITSITCDCSKSVCIPCWKSVVIARKKGFKCPYCNRANNNKLTPTEMNELFDDLDRRIGLIPE